jgi:hypothetical protein
MCRVEKKRRDPSFSARVHNPEYHRLPTPPEMIVPDIYADLMRERGK